MNKSEQTKEKLASTLITLLNQYPLDLITVSQLCKQANVGRTAFYNNFQHKEDVLKYIYRKMHQQTFQDKFKDFNYLISDEYIKDMISFFDQNTLLLNCIIKWNLIGYIARYNTETVTDYIKHYDQEHIKQYADYFMCYSSVRIFNLCFMWIMKNKDITATELFDLIRQFEKYYQE